MALVAAVLVVGFTGNTAFAWTDYLVGTSYGGRVYNDPGSNISIEIYASNGTNYGNYMTLWDGRWSNEYYNFRDTDSFYVKKFAYCVSPWGYYYKGGNSGTWFRLANDQVVLSLYCSMMGI